MRKLVFVSLLCAASICAQVTDAPLRTATNTVRRLTWLCGTWERQQKNSVLLEQWHQVDDTLMVGEGMSVKGSDTTITETMKLLARDSSLYFVAVVPHNDSAVYFRLSTVDSTGWLFENPAHDFPTKVSYRQVSADSLYARIEGAMNGTTKGIDFRFKRIK
jgi:hypothetical protein